MKSPLSWLRPKSAPKPDLELQLAGANELLTQAIAAEASAVDAHYETGTETAADAVDNAHKARVRAELHVTRAKRALDESAAAAAASERLRLHGVRDGLAAKITYDAVVSRLTPIAERKADLLVQLAELDIAQATLAGDLRDLEYQHDRVLIQLNEQPIAGLVDSGNGTSSLHSVRKYSELASHEHLLIAELERRTTRLPPRHPLHRALVAVRARPSIDLYAAPETTAEAAQ